MPRLLTLVTSSGLMAMIAFLTAGGALAQQPDQRPVPPRPPQQQAMPDEYRINLMIRGTVIALNQANITGNYSVLRDLGTPGFQVANNQARLAEIFAALRNRKLDLAPIMFFNPKLVTAPAIQDGQTLRLTGFFPTAPEQVNFDLAFQVFADQWMLAGIAVSTAQPSEAQRAAQTSSLQAPPPRAPSETAGPAEQKAGSAEAKPNRIDLSEPAPLPAKKPAAERKPKPAAQSAPAQAPKPQASNAAEPRPRTTNARPEAQPQ